MPVLVKANEAVAGRRTIEFFLVGTDGITPATGEAGGQPQVSVDGSAWTNVGIGTLTALGNGQYEAVLSATTVSIIGSRVVTRYKSANTAECPGESVRVVGFDPYDSSNLGLNSIPEADAGSTGGLPKLDTLQLIPVNVQAWLDATPNDLQSGRVDAYLGAAAAGVVTSTVAPNLNAPVAGVPAAVVDQTLTGHTTPGTVGGALNATGGGLVKLAADGLDNVLVASGLSPTGRITTPGGTPLVTLNARQALAILLATEVGDRTGIGTKRIVAALAGATDGTQVVADRVSTSTIQGSVVAPT